MKAIDIFQADYQMILLFKIYKQPEQEIHTLKSCETSLTHYSKLKKVHMFSLQHKEIAHLIFLLHLILLY